MNTQVEVFFFSFFFPQFTPSYRPILQLNNVTVGTVAREQIENMVNDELRFNTRLSVLIATITSGKWKKKGTKRGKFAKKINIFVAIRYHFDIS